MSYGLGIKALKRLCAEQNPMAWQKAKLSADLFKTNELPVFEWMADHLKLHHALPQVETLQQHWPETGVIETPEPISYYLKLVEDRFYYDTINQANLDSQSILKENQAGHEQALEVLHKAITRIQSQKYRVRILDVGTEMVPLIFNNYHEHMKDSLAQFGWPYMDVQSGGVMPGDVISFIGRPASGKTWLSLYTAMKNWRDAQNNVLFVSMEMMTLPVAQRVAAMYAETNINQLKMASYSTPVYKKFAASMKLVHLEKAKFYVVDGNLAASVEDIFILADMLHCRVVFIDGAYLLRHKNTRLDRFVRAAENVELIKRHVTDMGMVAFCSWQFNRTASEKQKKGKGEQGDLEDIGYSDAIGQISSIALGLFQEEGIETLQQRRIRVLKGRNGELGQFAINWDFMRMNFDQIDPPLDGQTTDQEKELVFV